METRVINFNESAISYKMYCSGRPVIFIHGFAEDSSIWNVQAAHLKDDFTLIIPDLPGSGASEMLKSQRVSIADYAEVIKEIIDREQLFEVVMIGHSMGGYIALAFAEKYPQLLKAIGLFHSSAYADDNDKIAMRKKAIGFITENGSEAFLKTSTPALFFDTDAHQSSLERLIKNAAAFRPEALIQYYNAMINRPSRIDVLKNFPGPVLWIIGEHDKAIPFKQSLQQSHIPAFSQVEILRKSGHLGILEETGRSNAILAQFLHSNA